LLYVNESLYLPGSIFIMNIWILAKKEVLNESHAIRRFCEEAELQNISVSVYSPDDFDIVANDEGARSIHINGKYLKELPDCVIPRMGAGTTYFALAIIRQLENLGVYCLNGSESIDLAKDKLASLQELAVNNVKIPKTMLAKMPVDTKFVSKEFHFPVVLKRITGSQGKGIVLCKSKEQLYDTIELIDTEPNLIIQEYIKASRGKDIRVFVLGGRAIGAMLRKAAKNTFKANFSKGGTVENFPLTSELEWLAVESARLIGLDCAGVDILFDKQGYVVCEVNSSPGFKGFEQATGINVPKVCYDFLRVRLGIGAE
jgi:gamma-F420-2:alpha-L-glutamate ligase